MTEILEKRRVFEMVKEQTWESKWIKNPHFNLQDSINYGKQGRYYPQQEYIEKEIPKTVRRKRSHIEYRIKCSFCGGTNGWVRRKDAKFCSGSCRNLFNQEENKK